MAKNKTSFTSDTAPRHGRQKGAKNKLTEWKEIVALIKRENEKFFSLILDSSYSIDDLKSIIEDDSSDLTPYIRGKLLAFSNSVEKGDLRAFTALEEPYTDRMPNTINAQIEMNIVYNKLQEPLQKAFEETGKVFSLAMDNGQTKHIKPD